MAVRTPAEVEKEQLGYSLVTIRGKSLRIVERVCASSDVCLFFVHGGGGRAGQFKHQISHFEKDYNVIALDFLGHGGSPSPNQPNLYTVGEHFEDLQAVYELYKKKRNIFISHCYGTIHTLHLIKWLHQKGRAHEVMGIVSISLGARAPVSLGLLGKVPAFILEWLRPLARSTSNRNIFTPNTDPALIQFENSISESNRMYMMKVIGADCSNNEMWMSAIQDGTVAMGDIPRICMYGEEDGVFPMATCQEAAKMLGVGKEACHLIKGVGHLCMLEGHEKVTEICQKFISEPF